MYAIIKINGHQHRVEKNQVILVDNTEHAEGAEFPCEQVLLVANDGQLKMGAPFVAGARVNLKVMERRRGRKIHGFIYHRRKGTRRTWGHRQLLQRLKVVDIKS